MASPQTHPFHPHQHCVKVVGTGKSLDQALAHALAGLNDPKGHNSHIDFRWYDLVKVGGALAADGSTTVQVTLEAYGSHKE